MGIGYALSENLKHEEGRVLVTDFADYLMCRAPDLPEITPIVVTAEDPYGPFGAKGVGEATTSAVVTTLITLFIVNYFLSTLFFK